MKKFFLFMLVIIMFSACTQVELYDSYNEKWNLDLPRPNDVLPGHLKTQSKMPQSSENFDLYLNYNAVGDISDRSFWVELSDEERYQLISDLSEIQGTKGATAEAKRKELEALLGVNLGKHCKAFLKQQFRQGTTEKVILLQSKQEAQIYLVHIVE